MVDSNGIAGLTEDFENILGGVREEVSRVRVLALPNPVHDPAAIGMDETAQELPRVVVNDLSLPIRQPDRALVLQAGAVLRE